MPHSHIDALIALGMTPLEAAVYACLLERPGSTGYAVAREVHKPTANTYKALASLESRGAATVSGQGRRLYRAVAPDELFDTLERRFRHHRNTAARGLSRLEARRGDDGIHELRTRDQVFARLRRMLARCRTRAVLDLSPPAVAAVADALAATAGSGAEVFVKVYESVEIEGVACVAAREGPPGHTAVSAATDAREMVLATLDPEDGGVRRAIWTVHPDLAAVVHRSLVAELLFAEVDAGLARGLSIDELEDTFASYARLRREGDAG